MRSWRALLAGVVGSLVLLTLWWSPKPPAPAEAQGVGIFERANCSQLTLPVTGATYCFEQQTNVLKVWNGATWTQANATQTGVNNVRDYGATGNGTTDDAAAIQRTLNAASATVANGGVVYLPPGQYLLGSRLTIYSNTSLLGTGWGSVLRVASTITTNAGQAIITQGSGVIRTRNILLADFQIDGNKANVALDGTPTEAEQSCVNLDFVASVTISNLYVHDCVENGLYINNSPENVAVVGGTYADNGKAGASAGRGIAFSVSPTMFRIANTYITGNRTQGISIQGEGGQHAASFTISNNVVRNNTQDGIDLTDNATSGSATQDIFIRQWAVTGNLVQGNGRFGIRVSENGAAVGGFRSIAQDGVIAGNTVQGNGNDGIRLSTLADGGLRRVVVTGNVSSGNTGFGVVVSAATAANITDVTIDGNALLANTSGAVSDNGTRTRVGVYASDSTVNLQIGLASNVLAFGGVTATGSSAGAIVVPNTVGLAVMNAAGTGVVRAIDVNSSNQVNVGGGGELVIIGVVNRFTGSGGLQLNSPAGADQGAGTINFASAVYANGRAVIIASTASANITNVLGISATESRANNLRGTCNFPAAATCQVAFAQNEPDVHYFVAGISCSASAASAVHPVSWASKSKNGFTLQASVSNSNSCDWLLIR